MSASEIFHPVDPKMGGPVAVQLAARLRRRAMSSRRFASIVLFMVAAACGRTPLGGPDDVSPAGGGAGGRAGAPGGGGAAGGPTGGAGGGAGGAVGGAGGAVGGAGGAVGGAGGAVGGAGGTDGL